MRAIYTGSCDEPKPGSFGTAHPAAGHDDQTSPQFGAWTFVPDDQPDRAYYVAEEDFEELIGVRVFGHFDIEVQGPATDDSFGERKFEAASAAVKQAKVSIIYDDFVIKE